MQWKRVIVIVIWMSVAFWGWLFAILLGGQMLVYGQTHYGWPRPPEWTLPVLIYGVMGCGTLLITVTALLLGLRGRLPWTKVAEDPRRGFPVESSDPPVMAPENGVSTEFDNHQ